MSSTFRKIWVVVALLTLNIPNLSAQTASTDPELMSLLLAFKAKIATEVGEPFAKAKEELNQNYVQALGRAQQNATVKGKLEEAEALRAEKEAMTANNVGGLPTLAPNLRELATLRKKYLDAMQTLRGAMQKKQEPLERELARQLELLALKMNRAGKADAALEARRLAKNYLEHPGIIQDDWQDLTDKVTPKPTTTPILLRKRDTLSTLSSFKPPIEIEVVAKLESLDLRLGYAAKEVIFNWERKPDELRIDGGPADRIYTPRMGEFPQNKFATILWVVLKDKQILFVDGKQRFEHRGDYAEINRPITIQAYGSEVTVQSIKIRRPVSP